MVGLRPFLQVNLGESGPSSRLGLLTINRLIDPGRRIEYNFLGSINRKAALTRGHATRGHAALPRAATRGAKPRAALPRHMDAGTRLRARTYHD